CCGNVGDRSITSKPAVQASTLMTSSRWLERAGRGSNMARQERSRKCCVGSTRLSIPQLLDVAEPTQKRRRRGASMLVSPTRRERTTDTQLRARPVEYTWLYKPGATRTQIVLDDDGTAQTRCRAEHVQRQRCRSEAGTTKTNCMQRWR